MQSDQNLCNMVVRKWNLASHQSGKAVQLDTLWGECLVCMFVAAYVRLCVNESARRVWLQNYIMLCVDESSERVWL